MKFIIRLLITAAVAYGLSLILTPHVRIDSYVTALLFSLVLAFLNAIVKPIFVILTLPITILTLGIFLLLLNVLMVLLADSMVYVIPIQAYLCAFLLGILWSI